MSSELSRRVHGGDLSIGADIDTSALPTLQVEDLAQESEGQLVARGAALAREYKTVAGKATTLLKNLAVTQVALRVQLDDPRGESKEYRDIVGEMYRRSDLSRDETTTMQAAVRWHISNVLRQVLTPRQLEAARLQPTSALERLQDSRAVNSDLLRAVKASRAVEESTPPPRSKRRAPADDQPAGQPVKATADHLRLAQVARDMMGRLDRNVIKRDMTDGQRAALDRELAALERKLASLRKLTQKPTSDG